MAIKKLLINGTVWTYLLESRSDGLYVTVTHDAYKQSYMITHHTHDVRSGLVQWECDGKLFARVIHQDAESHVVMDTVVNRSLRISEVIPHHKTSTVTSLVKVNHVKSPLAGKVMKICVEIGQRVHEGQPLCVIESMKMENEIRSPRAGIIKTIFMSVGNVVQPNHIMIEFEKEGEGSAAAKNSHGQTTF
ncbi:MAG: acetyl-CoA carboxylase biotin carboxyl carrier protein subunit [Candidatus Babeliales bacterium]|jgi:biotin carboxyl carrier protein